MLTKEKEDPNFPRCLNDRSFLVKKIGKTKDGKQFWQCPKCKKIYSI